MEEITQKLQELAKSRRIQKLIYKQSNTKPGNLFVNDFIIAELASFTWVNGRHCSPPFKYIFLSIVALPVMVATAFVLNKRWVFRR